MLKLSENIKSKIEEANTFYDKEDILGFNEKMVEIRNEVLKMQKQGIDELFKKGDDKDETVRFSKSDQSRSKT